MCIRDRAFTLDENDIETGKSVVFENTKTETPPADPENPEPPKTPETPEPPETCLLYTSRCV